MILKNYLDMVVVIKEKETWSIKVIDVKTRPHIDNYVFKSLTSHINVKNATTHRLCIQIINIAY